MFRINKHFDGNVVSIAFQTEALPATVGVMAVGDYTFDTNTKETVTVINGALTVKLPGRKNWQTFSNGEQFIVEANKSFQLKVAVATAYLCTYEKISNKKLVKKKAKKTKKIISHENKRRHERYDVGKYPVEVKKPDGTILKAVLNDISYRGFQIVCTGLTSRIFSQETGLLMNDDTNEVEISIKVPSKKKKEIIIADCRVVYIAKNEDIAGKNSFVVGLQVIYFKGKSLDIIKQLVNKLNP